MHARQELSFRTSVQTVLALALALFAGIGPLVAQDIQAPPPCPKLKLQVGMPDDVIQPQGNVLLEIKLVNNGPVETMVPSGSPDVWGYEVELRDEQGTAVPRTTEWMQALSKRPPYQTLNASVPLAPGVSLSKTVLLDKLFDLRSPGRYSVRMSFVHFGCGSSGTRVTSNVAEFFIQTKPQFVPGSASGIDVAVNALQTTTSAGWAVPLSITIRNKSNRSLRWAVDDPPNIAPDEYLSGAEVSGPSGAALQRPERQDPNWSSSNFRYAVTLLDIAPGKSAEQIVLLGDLLDVSGPGKYKAQISLLDPLSKGLVSSNVVPFEIENVAAGGSSLKQPPFVVTLHSAHFSFPPNPSDLLICLSNISDHDINLDNFALKDFATVEGPDEKMAAMNQTALKDWEPGKLKQVSAGPQGCCSATVKPRKALCGGIKLGVVYDMSRPGAYRVRVDRYDEPDAIPGQKLGALPLVHSNWLTIVEPSPAK